MSAWTVRLTARPPDRLFRLVLESHDGRAPGADSEEKHEPVSDIDTVVVDSLKALDPEWPIREADIAQRGWHGRKVPPAEQKSATCRHVAALAPGTMCLVSGLRPPSSG